MYPYREWDKFLGEIEREIQIRGSGRTLWFRGIPDSSYKLVPSLLRYSNGLDKERELFSRYGQWSFGLHDQGPAASRSDWEQLFEMQHFGIPTRLLDWSEVLGMAIFFATYSGSSTDGAIFVLDPIELNKKSGKADFMTDWSDQEFYYRKVFWEGKPFLPQLPLAINPSHRNYRLLAQRGRFTVHGYLPKPLEDQAPDCVSKILFPARARDGAKRFLEMAGINEFSSFPDIQGAAPFIKGLVGLK